jgi:hypothetical protein
MRRLLCVLLLAGLLVAGVSAVRLGDVYRMPSGYEVVSYVEHGTPYFYMTPVNAWAQKPGYYRIDTIDGGEWWDVPMVTRNRGRYFTHLNPAVVVNLDNESSGYMRNLLGKKVAPPVTKPTRRPTPLPTPIRCR